MTADPILAPRTAVLRQSRRPPIEQLDQVPSAYAAEPVPSRHMVRHKEVHRTGPTLTLPRAPRWASLSLWGCAVVCGAGLTLKLLTVLF